MSIRGKWRVVETPGYDMAVAGAFILFDEDGGEFAFDCLHEACENGFSNWLQGKASTTSP